MTNLERRTTVSVLWVSAQGWGQQLLQFLIFVILARLLGPETYGLLAMALFVIIVGDVLITNGGWTGALIQRRDLDASYTDTVFWSLLVIACSLAGLVSLLASAIAAAFQQPALAELIVWLSPVLPLASLCVVPDALLRREFRYAPLALRSLLATLVAGLVAVPIAFAGFGVWSLITFQLTQSLIQAVVLWLSHPWRPTLCFSGRQLHEITRYVGGVLGARVMGVVDDVIPRIVLGYALGPAAVGQFNAARKVVELLMQLVIQPVTRVSMASFADLRADRARTQTLFTSSAQFAALLAFPSHIGLALIAPQLIPLVFGPVWSPSIPILQVLALFGLIFPLSGLCTALMHGIGRVGWQLILAAGATVLFLSLVALLALLGLTGMFLVACAAVARSFLVFPLRVYVVQRTTGVDVRPALLGGLRLLLATGFMAAAVLGWQQLVSSSLGPTLSIIGSVLVGLSVYCGSVALLARPLVQQIVRLIRSIGYPLLSSSKNVG